MKTDEDIQDMPEIPLEIALAFSVISGALNFRSF